MVPIRSVIAAVYRVTHTILPDRTLIRAPDCVPQSACDSYAGREFNPNADPGRGEQLRYAGSPWTTGAPPYLELTANHPLAILPRFGLAGAR
jgi:hypothetical protein